MGKKRNIFQSWKSTLNSRDGQWNLVASWARFLRVLFAFSPHTLHGGGQFLPWSFGKENSYTEKWELPCWLRSSTRMISLRRAFGAVSIMLCTVLSRVDQASSWKQMMTLAVGRLESYFCCRHLHGWNEEDTGNTGTNGWFFFSEQSCKQHLNFQGWRAV